MEKKKRSARCSPEQLNYLVDYIFNNRELLMVKHSATGEEGKLIEMLWNQLVNEINAVKGAKKTVDQWKRVSN